MVQQKQFLFVVVAYCDTPRGFAARPITATDGLSKAVGVARTAERLGFVFASPESRIEILALKKDAVYGDADYVLVGPFVTKIHSKEKGHPVIYQRDRMTGEWRERWFQKVSGFEVEFEAQQKKG